MSAEHTIEVTGDTIDNAIAKGLAELGVGPGDVIVEVLDEPSRGMFGLGARPARVRLKLFKPPTPPPAQPAPQRTPPPSYRQDDDKDDDESLLADMAVVEDESQLGEDARVGKSILLELLGKMGLSEAVITVHQPLVSAGDESDSPWLLNVSGEHLNSLIGRRGETLASLQYITRLVASRELQHRANIIVDVSGYKSRRSQMLRDLANRMADQAVQSNRVVTLEPMPPYERRIIHLTLRSRDDVLTKSVGEGDSRKVTIVPKK